MVQLRREVESLRKMVENEKRQTQSIKKKIIEQRAFYSGLLGALHRALETCLEIGGSNLRSCRDLLLRLR